jgi:small ligand-binding sensory domain FIST
LGTIGVTRIAAGLSTAGEAGIGAREAAAQAAARLDGGNADLAFLFLSPDHRQDVEAAVAAVEAELAPSRLLGCVAQGVVARDRELEVGPGAAVWAASLPNAQIDCFHASATSANGGVAVTGFPRPQGDALLVLLVDPFTFPAAPLLARLNEDHPGLALIGGLAAAGNGPGEAALISEGEVHEEGAVGAVISGVRSRTLVSQGCAPIGREAVVTRAEGNVVFELAGQPALERLREEIEALPEDQQVLAARGLLAGLVIDENAPEYGRGDFLMRGLLGADEDSGALAVGESVRVGQTLRFHVRDAASADRDLREALDEVRREKVAGALLFTCNGRGTQMFPEPHHDAHTVSAALGTDAVAGFFCGGEIGPVGGRTFLHGFTATMAVFLDD